MEPTNKPQFLLSFKDFCGCFNKSAISAIQISNNIGQSNANLKDSNVQHYNKQYYLRLDKT